MERLLRRLLLRVERRPVGVLLVVQCLRRGVLVVVERCQLGIGRVRMLGVIRIRVRSSEGVRSVFRR